MSLLTLSKCVNCAVWRSDTTGNAPHLGDGQVVDQRVAPRTNAPRKTIGTGTEAGESVHEAGTAAGPGPETGNEPGRCSSAFLHVDSRAHECEKEYNNIVTGGKIFQCN